MDSDLKDILLIVLGATGSLLGTAITLFFELRKDRGAAKREAKQEQYHRAREAVILAHKANIRFMHYYRQKKPHDELYITTHAEISAVQAELRGIIAVIKDKELTNLVNNLVEVTQESDPVATELAIIARSEALHTRITDLLEKVSDNP